MLENRFEENPSFPLENIVFATDFLESSRLALDYAAAFALLYRSKLTIVHAFELSSEAEEVEILSRGPSMSRANAAARLEAFASGVRRLGIRTETDLRDGDPVEAVLDAAIDNHADLLVLGTHGVYRGLQHLLVGSNAEKILLSAECPTLTVGRHVMAGIDLVLNFNKILLVADFSPESVDAAQCALSLGRDLGIGIELLQTAPDRLSTNSPALRNAAERFCEAIGSIPGCSELGWCSPEFQLGRVCSPEDVVKSAKSAANSLLVLGVHWESRWNRHIHATFAYELVAKASCPILGVHRR